MATITGGGGLKKADALADTLDKVEKTLQSVDAIFARINGNAGGVSNKMATAAGNGGVGSGKKLFNSGGQFSTPIAGSDDQGGNSMPWAYTFSQNHPRAAGAIRAGLTAGAVGWDLMPGVADATSQRQAMFSATLGYGSTMPDYEKLKTNMMNAFGGYATSANSQENVASYMARFGMSSTNGQFSNNARSFMDRTSAMSLLTGMSQEESARVSMSMSSGQNANKLFMLGISSTNKDGSPKDFGESVKQVMDRNFRGKYTKEDVDRGLAAGGVLRSNLTRLFGENSEAAIEYARTIAATGSQDGKLSTETLKTNNLTDPQRSPMAKQMEATGVRSETTAKYASDLIAGWDKALSAANAVERVMQNLSGVLGPLAGGKGFVEGFAGTAAGSALGGLAGPALSGALGKGGAKAKGGAKGGSKGKGGSKSKGGSRAARAGIGKAGPIGAAVAIGTSIGAEAITEANGGEENFWSKALGVVGSTASGAAMGSMAGPWGTAIGAVAGLGLGLYDAIWGGEGEATSDGSAGINLPATGGSSGGTTTATAGGRGSNRSKTVSGQTPSAAIQRAYVEAGKGPQTRWYKYCARFVAHCWGLPNSGYASASVQWRSIPSKFKYPGRKDAPPGALYFWTGGSGGHGHVVLSVGGGKVATNDVAGPGKISIETLDRVIRFMSRGQFVGWAQPYYRGRVLYNVGGGGSGETVENMAGVEDPAGAAGLSGGAVGSSQTSVPAWTARSTSAGLIGASAYGGVSSSEYSISEQVTSSVASAMMAGGAEAAAAKKPLINIDGSAQSGDAPGSVSAYSTPGAGKGVARWSGVALKAMEVAGLDKKYLPLLLHRMQVESGGDPNAVNKTDSNAKRGTPSKGLMQVIGPTFDAYAGPYKSLGQTDPFANIYAAIKYSQSRYGEEGLTKAWSGRSGYSEGSWRIAKDEITKVHQGEMVVPAAAAEAIRTSMGQMRTGGGGKTGGKTEVTLHLTGQLGYDVDTLVRAVKAQLEKDTQTSLIGGF